MYNLTCEQCAELLSARLDDMISQEEAQALETHLSQCPECRQLARGLEQLHDAFVETRETPIPARIAQKFMARIAKPWRRRPVFKAMAGLAACAVICVGLYGATKTQQFPTQPTAQAVVNTRSEAVSAPVDGTAAGKATGHSIAPRVAAGLEAAPAQEDAQADMADNTPSNRKKEGGFWFAPETTRSSRL